MGIPLSKGPQRPLDGTRKALMVSIGLAAGLIPAACAIIFFATLCPISDYTCSYSTRDTTNLIQGYLFAGACLTYLAQMVATVACFIPRATRPVAWGLLIMLFLGPIITLLGWGYVSTLKNPLPGNI